MKMNDHEFLVAIAKSALGVGPAIAPPVEQPTRTAADLDWKDAYEDAYQEAAVGAGWFWCGGYRDAPRWDNEQELGVFAAVRTACSMPGATDAERWQCVSGRLRSLIDDYAQWRADERTK